MIRSIAVTTDFSRSSTVPFIAAAEIARKFGARVQVVHVMRPPEVFVPWQILPPTESSGQSAECQSRLEDLVREFPALAALRPSCHALSGACAQSVADFGKLEGVDLLLVASHGDTGPAFPLGSFTSRILEFSSCPVLVFPAEGAMTPSGGEFLPPRRILVPYDFSPSARAVLSVVAEWARAYDADVRLVFVLEPEGARARGGAPDLEEDAARARALEVLREVASSRLPGVRVEAVVRWGHPAVEILDEAERQAADMVILGSRGLSPVERIELGSTALRVVSGARRPVLVVRE